MTKGNEEIEIIYGNYAGQLFGYLLSILWNRTDTEDVLQNLFLKIVRRRKRIFSARNLKRYLFAMARNEARDFIKAKIKNRKLLKEKMNELFLEPKSQDISFEEKERVNLVLSNLPAEQKEVITLKIWQGFTFKEIGRILKVSSNTCASRYRYGLEKLKEELKIWIQKNT